jgi:Protein of unknown function (DUF1460)
MLVPLLAAAAVLQLTPAQLDREIARAHRLRSVPARIERLSALFVGVPYGDFPLGEGGEGPEPQARWRVDAVDCQTFVETVLAMANGDSLARAKEVLDDIRYAHTPPRVSFANRNHFTEAQWLPSNQAKGYLRERTSGIDPAAPTTELVLRRNEWSSIAALRRLSAADVPEGTFPIRYLPLDRAQALASRIESGTVLMVVREHDPQRVVRVSHMGFVVRDARGRKVVRHASFGAEKKVIDVPLGEFLELQKTYKKWPVAGVALATPLDASDRVAQLAASR